MALSDDWYSTFAPGVKAKTEQDWKAAQAANEKNRYAAAREAVLRPQREKVALEQPNLAMAHPELARLPTSGPRRIEAIKKTKGKLGTGKGQLFDGGVFSDIIDILSVPQYAATGLFDTRVSIADAVQNRYSPSESLGLNGAKGFAADVLLDPLNFIGIGGASKLGEAAKAGKAITEGGKVVEAGTKGARAIEEAATLAGKVRAGQRGLLTARLPGTKGAVSLLPKAVEAPIADLITKGAQNLKRIGVGEKNVGNVLADVFGTLKTAKGVSKIDDIERIMKASKVGRYQAKKLARLGSISDAKALDKITPIVKMVKKAKLSGEDLLAFQRKVSNYGTRAAEGIKLSKKAEPIYKKLKPLLKESQKAFEKTGIKQQTGKVLPLIPTKEGNEILSKFIKPSKTLAKKESLERFGTTFKLGDDIVVGTPKEAKGVISGKVYKNIDEEWIPKGGGEPLTRKAVTAEEANKAFGKEVYKTDVVEALYNKMAQTGRVNARNKFTLEAAQRFGKEVKGGVVPPGYTKVKGVKQLEGFAFEKPIAEALETSYEAFTNPGTVRDFLKAYDKVLNFWKKTATYVNPAFHTRNVVSNHWQMWLAGVKNPKDMYEGYNITRKVSMARKAGKKLKDVLSKEDLKAYKEFVDEGLGGTGYFLGDFTKSIKPENFLFEKMGKVGSFLEDSAKFAVYRAKRKAGWSAERAAEQVRKFMFDYGDLTGFEKNVFKRAMPFYTWTRKNVPLQVAMLIEKPTTFNVIGKAKRAIESTMDGEPMDDKLLPSWMREGYNVWLGENPDGTSNYFNLEGFLPAVDLGKLGRPTEIPLEQMSPLIKSPLELMTNYDIFFEQPIEEYAGQQKEYFGVNIPAKLEHVLRSIRPASELEKVLGLNYQTKDLDLTKRGAKLLAGTPLRRLNPTKEMWKRYWDVSADVDILDRDMSRAESSGNKGEVERLAGLKKEKRGQMADFLASGLQTAIEQGNKENELKIDKAIKYMKLNEISDIKGVMGKAKSFGNQGIIAELEKNKTRLNEEVDALNKVISKLSSSKK